MLVFLSPPPKVVDFQISPGLVFLERSDGFVFLFFFQSYSEMIAERRKRVADGFEDIYGKNKT